MENIDFSDLSSQPQPQPQSQPQPQPQPQIRNTHINIGTGKEISIKNLAKLVKQKVGFNGELFFNTEKPDGTTRKLTNVTKLHNLGWHHKIDIEEGLAKMYNWYVK